MALRLRQQNLIVLLAGAALVGCSETDSDAFCDAARRLHASLDGVVTASSAVDYTDQQAELINDLLSTAPGDLRLHVSGAFAEPLIPGNPAVVAQREHSIGELNASLAECGGELTFG